MTDFTIVLIIIFYIGFLFLIADFVAARYGKSQGVTGLVAVIAVIGILPYISL
ncbi:MAG: hypothetical protein V7776_22245 [Halopseudomonas aestusnigri]